MRGVENIPLYRNSELRILRALRPKEEGRIAIVTNAGRGAVDVGHIGAKVIAGRETVSDGVARTTGGARVRPNRVVLTPGVCASSLVVMCAAQPGARTSHPQGDGGNSASLPGESATYAVPTTAQGRPGCPGYTCMPLCKFLTATSHSGPRVPAGSRPSLRPLSIEGEEMKQSSGETSREDAKVCLLLRNRKPNVAACTKPSPSP
jgi:hypothetical protein